MAVGDALSNPRRRQLSPTIKQVEIVAPNLPAALATGQIDAASLIHSQAYRALQSGDFVSILVWANAPMFKGANLDDYNHIGRTMRAYWAAFVRNGNPNTPGLLTWPVYDDARNVMRFDRYIAPAADPAGSKWRYAFKA